MVIVCFYIFIRFETNQHHFSTAFLLFQPYRCCVLTDRGSCSACEFKVTGRKVVFRQNENVLRTNILHTEAEDLKTKSEQLRVKDRTYAFVQRTHLNNKRTLKYNTTYEPLKFY
jgi:hypothetical protein